jgi:PAS domain S-box-containing protein
MVFLGALVVVLDPQGRIVRFNRACEQTTGFGSRQVTGKFLWDVFAPVEEREQFQALLEQLRNGALPNDHECHWVTRTNGGHSIAWSSMVLPDSSHLVATGVDITERNRLEKTILEISAREQQRIGQDLHDDLGQQLTGISFLCKAQERKLKEKSLPEAVGAATIVGLVSEAISATRELARRLAPWGSEALVPALERWSNEVETRFRVSCRLQCSEGVGVTDAPLSRQLYHIAQEAVHNAIKHGKARNIEIELTGSNGCCVLTIRDDGAGFPQVPERQPGIGLHIMRCRASMIRGSLDVQTPPAGGAIVTCRFPLLQANE